MSRLTFLLCLLMVAALRWIIGSAEALIITEQHEAVLPTPDLTLEAVNIGFKASLVAASIRAEDAAWVIHEPLWVAIDAGAHSTNAILSRSSRRVEFELIEIAAGKMIENLPPTSDRA
jgi:hypothetical protein